jgi:hypothetical protein
MKSLNTLFVIGLLMAISQTSTADEIVNIELGTGYVTCESNSSGENCQVTGEDVKPTSMTLQAGNSTGDLAGIEVVETQVGHLLIRYIISVTKQIKQNSARYVIGIFTYAYDQNNTKYPGGLVGYSIVKSMTDPNTINFIGAPLSTGPTSTLKPSVTLHGDK